MLLARSGLRLMACSRLCVMDIDFDHRAIAVRRGKGGQGFDGDPRGRLDTGAASAMEAVGNIQIKDIADGLGAKSLPHPLDARTSGDFYLPLAGTLYSNDLDQIVSTF